MSPKNKMTYDNLYLKFGFTNISDGEEKLQCVLCCPVLTFTSLKPSKLKRHFKKYHPTSFYNDVDLFKQKTKH